MFINFPMISQPFNVKDSVVKRFDFRVANIPTIVWGDQSAKIFIAIHGNMSNKADDVIAIFAEEAMKSGCQVLSFDLPKHGNRKKATTRCKIQNCVEDLHAIMKYVKSISNNASVFGCSIGACFSPVAYRHEGVRQAMTEFIYT